MVTNFHGKRFAGSLQWRAPEYVQGQKFYFKKPPNYWCSDCMSRDTDRSFNSSGGYTAGRSSSHSSRTTNTDITKGENMGVLSNFSFKCIKCKEKVIFDYYKKADIYAAGLVMFPNMSHIIYMLLYVGYYLALADTKLKTKISVLVYFQNYSSMCF